MITASHFKSGPSPAGGGNETKFTSYSATDKKTGRKSEPWTGVIQTQVSFITVLSNIMHVTYVNVIDSVVQQLSLPLFPP